MTACVVVVRFELEAGRREDFLPLIETNARASVTREPGCRRFDVVLPGGEPDAVLLYEIYDDEAAFAEHQRSDHFREFDAQTSALVRSKQVTVGRLSADSPPAAEARA